MNANRVKFYKFKTKDTEIKQYLLYLGNNTKCFTVDKTRKGRLNYDHINVDNVLGVHKYLMAKHNIKQS